MSSGDLSSDDSGDEDDVHDAAARTLPEASGSGESNDDDAEDVDDIFGHRRPTTMDEPLPEFDDGETRDIETKKRCVRRKKQSPLGVCLVNCKYPLLHDITTSLGYKPVEEDGDWCLFWTDTSVAIERVMRLKPTQKINHFVGMLEICRKKALARNLARIAAKLPHTFNFAPQTFVLPEELETFMDVVKANKNAKTGKNIKKLPTYILKPDAGCQGKGISLVQTDSQTVGALKELGMLGADGERVKNPILKNPNINVVAQTYLSNPFLIDGRKFDLRVYALVTSANPLRMFVYSDGLVRFCTTKYFPPDSKNMSNQCMHLTNYSLNKHSENFVRAEDVGCLRVKTKTPADRARALLRDGGTYPEGISPQEPLYDSPEVESPRSPSSENPSIPIGDGGVASKWSVQNGLKPWMARNGYDFESTWDAISDVCVKTVIAAAPTLRHNYRNAMRQMDDKNEKNSDGDGTSKGNDAGYNKHLKNLCFEILGIDVMLDSRLKPWLVEVNHSPSFATDSPLDLQVKENLIKDTINLIKLDQKTIRRRNKLEQTSARARLGVEEEEVPKAGDETLGDVKKLPETTAKLKPKAKAKENHGAFNLVFPNPDSGTQKTYDECLHVASENFEQYGAHAKARDAMKRASEASQVRLAEARVKYLFRERGVSLPVGDRFRRVVEKAMRVREKTGVDVEWDKINPRLKSRAGTPRTRFRGGSKPRRVSATEVSGESSSDDDGRARRPYGGPHNILTTLPASSFRDSLVTKLLQKPRGAAPTVINLQGDAIRKLMASRAAEAKAAAATAQAKRIGTLSLGGGRDALDAVRRFEQKVGAPRDLGIALKPTMRRAPSSSSHQRRDVSSKNLKASHEAPLDGFGFGLVGEKLR